MPSIPSVGDRFSVLQQQLLKNARKVDSKSYEGGMDGLHRQPVKDLHEYFDTNGDGKADVGLFTRTQDSGAWSNDGLTGRQVVTARELELLDGQGRVTDEFDELHAPMKNGHVSTRMEGELVMSDLVGSVSHIDYGNDGSRIWDWTHTHAKDGAGDGQIAADLDHVTTKVETFPK